MICCFTFLRLFEGRRRFRSVRGLHEVNGLTVGVGAVDGDERTSAPLGHLPLENLARPVALLIPLTGIAATAAWEASLACRSQSAGIVASIHGASKNEHGLGVVSEAVFLVSWIS